MKILDVRIEIPDSASAESIQLAGEKARETAVLILQQQGEMTIRDAAAELGLTYEGYLDLLHERGLPATHDTSSPGVVDRILRSLGQSISDS